MMDSLFRGGLRSAIRKSVSSQARKHLRRRRAGRRSVTRLFLEALEVRALLSLTVATDKLDYAPESTALITAESLGVGETVQFQVVRTDGIEDHAPENEPWQVQDGISGFAPFQDNATRMWHYPDLDGLANGRISTTWYVDVQYAGASLRLTAEGLTSGETAYTDFTDSIGDWYFESSAYTVSESAGNVRIPIFFSRNQNGFPSTVDWSTKQGTAGGADYAASSGTVLVSHYDQGRIGWAVIPITDDSLSERSEDFRVQLSNPTNGAWLRAPYEATVTITDNDLPIANPDTYLALEDTPFTSPVSILANDTSGLSLTAFLLTFPSSGTITSFSQVAGTFEYTPAPDFFGSVSFTYSVGWWTGNTWIFSDPDNPGTVTIHVSPVSDAPVLAAIGNKTVDEGAALSFLVTATDVDGSVLTYSLDPASVDRGMTINAATGVFTWSPSENQGGATYPVTVTVTDDTHLRRCKRISCRTC